MRICLHVVVSRCIMRILCVIHYICKLRIVHCCSCITTSLASHSSTVEMHAHDEWQASCQRNASPSVHVHMYSTAEVQLVEHRFFGWCLLFLVVALLVAIAVQHHEGQ